MASDRTSPPATVDGIPGPSGVRRRGRALMGPGLGVAAGLGVWNIGNFVFFAIAGHRLGPADYGLIAALLSAVLVLMVPFTGIQSALATVVGAHPADDGALYAHLVRRTARLTLPAAAVVAAGTGLVGALFSQVPLGPLLAAESVLLPVAVFYLALGQMQGERRFWRYATSTAFLGVPRPLALLALFAIGLGVYAPLIGSAVTTVLAAAVALWFTRDRLRVRAAAPSPEDLGAFRTALVPIAVGASALAALTNVDVVFAKLTLSDHQAGIFAAVSVLAKALFVVPQAVTTIALPWIAARRRARVASPAALTGVAAVVIVVGLGATALAFAFADPIVRVTFGSKYADGADLLGPFTAAMTLVGLLMVPLYHHLALHSYRYVWLLAGAALLQLVLLSVLHDSGGTIVAVDAACAGLVLLLHDPLHRSTGEQLWRGARAIATHRRRQGGAVSG
jgi:O-antigen/teichoic acid export membrane protein